MKKNLDFYQNNGYLILKNFLTKQNIISLKKLFKNTLYRYLVCTVNCSATLELPSYFKFLNKNPQVKIAPKNNFGRGYGVVDDSLSCVDITTNCDGQFNVLVIGTRKDKMAVCAWKGVEPTKEIHGLGFDWEIE